MVALAQGPVEAQARKGAKPADFQSAIDQAVDRGVEYLLSTQRSDGSWVFESQRFPNGQTALCAYTLLKAGLSPNHQALQRALAWLKHEAPTETYSLACQVMAYSATRRTEERDLMVPLLDQLLDWQKGDFGYPWATTPQGWAPSPGRSDLSNTQFAAFAMDAARRAGVKIPRTAWNQLLRETLDYQAPAEDSALGEAAGFQYMVEQEQVTLSMTCAGLCVLEICKAGLDDRLTSKQARLIAEARQRALTWLDLNLDFENVGPKPKWTYYAAYGVERVGSLLALERVGQMDWYREGAKSLLRRQKRAGFWDATHPETDTCFALLFLRRATAPRTGGGQALSQYQASAIDEEHPLGLRASGQVPMTLWVVPGLQLPKTEVDSLMTEEATVEYFVNEELVAEVQPAKLREAGFALRHQFQKPGNYKIQARLKVPGRAGRFESPVMTVEVNELLDDWMKTAVGSRSANLVLKQFSRANSSSVATRRERGLDACDGRAGTRWMCQHDDQDPWIEIKLKKSVTANTLVLSPLGGSELLWPLYDHVTKLELSVDGRRNFEFELDPENWRPIEITLPKKMRIKSFKVRVLEFERAPGRRSSEDTSRGARSMYLPKPGVGFTEVGLEYRK